MSSTVLMPNYLCFYTFPKTSAKVFGVMIVNLTVLPYCIQTRTEIH